MSWEIGCLSNLYWQCGNWCESVLYHRGSRLEKVRARKIYTKHVCLSGSELKELMNATTIRASTVVLSYFPDLKKRALIGFHHPDKCFWTDNYHWCIVQCYLCLSSQCPLCLNMPSIQIRAWDCHANNHLWTCFSALTRRISYHGK